MFIRLIVRRAGILGVHTYDYHLDGRNKAICPPMFLWAGWRQITQTWLITAPCRVCTVRTDILLVEWSSGYRRPWLTHSLWIQHVTPCSFPWGSKYLCSKVNLLTCGLGTAGRVRRWSRNQKMLSPGIYAWSPWEVLEPQGISMSDALKWWN